MPAPTTRPRKTLDDYLALPDDVRAELLDGELYMSPAPGTPHQRVVGELFRALSVEVERMAAGEVFVGPLDVFLPIGDIVQPDVLLVGAAQRDALRSDGFHGAPALAIEVLSPSHPERDRFVKLWRYGQSGVQEYWVIDPQACSLELFRLEPSHGPSGGDAGSGRLVGAGWFTRDMDVRSPLLPDLQLPLRRLFP